MFRPSQSSMAIIFSGLFIASCLANVAKAKSNSVIPQPGTYRILSEGFTQAIYMVSDVKETDFGFEFNLDRIPWTPRSPEWGRAREPHPMRCIQEGTGWTCTDLSDCWRAPQSYSCYAVSIARDQFLIEGQTPNYLGTQKTLALKPGRYASGNDYRNKLTIRTYVDGGAYFFPEIVILGTRSPTWLSSSVSKVIWDASAPEFLATYNVEFQNDVWHYDQWATPMTEIELRNVGGNWYRPELNRTQLRISLNANGTPRIRLLEQCASNERYSYDQSCWTDYRWDPVQE